MSIKPFIKNFSDIGSQVFLRCDPKYRHFWDNMYGVSINQKSVQDVRLKSILLPSAKMLIKKGELDDGRIILELEDIEPRTSLIIQERIIFKIGSDKLDFGDFDLVFSRLRPYLGKIVINNTIKKYIGTTEWIPLKLNQGSISPLLLKYLLLLPPFLQTYNYLLSGKEHPRISFVDFRNIFIPLPPIEQQVKIENEIKPIESKMILLYQSLARPIDIINNIFAQEFGYAIEEYKKRAMQNTYQKSFGDLDKSLLIRNSVKFHHPKYDYLNEIMSTQPFIKLKTLCISPIHRGVQPIYDNQGDIQVIKTANLRNDVLDLSNCQKVNREFYEKKKEVAGIKKGDVLVASTGVGSIGKVDLYDQEEDAMVDGHVSIIRLDIKKIHPLYVTYYLRSILGNLQIERELSGSTNQIEIYPNQLEQIRIIDLPLKRRNIIVKEIRNELKKLQQQKKDIKKYRDIIDETILKELDGK